MLSCELDNIFIFAVVFPSIFFSYYIEVNEWLKVLSEYKYMQSKYFFFALQNICRFDITSPPLPPPYKAIIPGYFFSWSSLILCCQSKII